MNNSKIVVYATANHGDGRFMVIGEYYSIEDIEDIIIGMFDRDVVISFEIEKYEKK